MSNRESEEEEEEYEKEGRGRSENRRLAKTFDALAMDLLELSPGRCARFPVSDALRLAMKTAHSTKSKAARRRELRHLSGMLRNRPDEAAAIEAVLAGRPVETAEEGLDLEAMRESLCNPDTYSETLDEACAALPPLDVMLVRELCSALHVLDAASRCDAKGYRLLYRELRRASDEMDEESEGEP